MKALLEPYVSEGLVIRVSIGARVYSVNPTRINELEERIKALG